MNYIIVKNQQAVLLGPMAWRQNFFQLEFDDLGINFQVPFIESGYVKINSDYEIFPVVKYSGPEINNTFEQQVGPFYTYNNNQAESTFTSQQLPVDIIQQNLKQILSNERYIRESKGTSIVLNSTEYFLATDRQNRNIFDYALSTIGNDTVNWKFPQGFVTLGVVELQAIVNSIKTHVQLQFDWEKTMIDTIMAADTIDALVAIVIIEPMQLQPDLMG